MKTKICTKCNIEKNIDMFYKHSAYKDGHLSSCKDCHSIITTKYGKKRKKTKRGLAYKIYNTQKNHSKIRGHIPPSYTKEELYHWMISQQSFDALYNKWVDSDFDVKLIPSVDRKNDYAPYTINNIQLMTWRDNMMKGHEDRRQGINNKINKAVCQYSKDNELIKKYHSAHIADRETGIYQQNISKCCTNKRKTAGGFIWKFAT